MAVALVDLSHRAGAPVPVPLRVIRILIAHGCPLFRVGLRSLLERQDDYVLAGETTSLEDVLLFAREQRPDIVLLDGSLTSADPLEVVQQLHQAGVPGIMVFAPPTGDEETLFRFLMRGVMAYEDGCISGEELLAKLRRVALGEYLVTGDVLLAQAARRERRARIRRDALPMEGPIKTCRPSPQEEDCTQSVSGNDSPLTDREQAMLEQFARGGTLAQVARVLGISYHTAKNSLSRSYQKLSVNDRTLAVVIALHKGWITVDGIHLLSL